MIELFALYLKVDFDIEQLLPIGELHKGYTQVMILADKVLDVVIAIVALNTHVEMCAAACVRTPARKRVCLCASLSRSNSECQARAWLQLVRQFKSVTVCTASFH